MADMDSLLGRDPTLGWRAKAEALEAENERLRNALSGVLRVLSVWRPVQPSPDPSDCSAGYPEHVRRAWSDAVDVLGGTLR